MAVQEITVRDRDDFGQVQERSVSVRTTEFFITVEDQQFTPAVVTNVEIEHDGDVADPQDQCGNVERTKTSNKGWNVRVEGIVTANDERPGNLSMQLMRDYVATTDSVSVRSDLFEGEIVVSNVVITQSNDLVSVNTHETDGQEMAFEFQLQLGEEETQ